MTNKVSLSELKEIFEFIKNGPLEELKDKEIIKSYDDIMNKDFEIAVVATMSSGKSTLINAMLASDIIPAKNEACTAKISKIKNVDKDKFSVIAYDKNDNIIETYQNVTAEKLTELNDREDVLMTCIEGKFSNIDTNGENNLVLIDTPGPNNSQDSSHAERTMEVIKNYEHKPVVLYIMNATQLGTNDDKHLLGIIRDEMSDKDKQSKDRFIFVLNKIDQIDAEKECVESIINNARKYLESNGINEPNIYPMSAYIAKNIRNYLKGNELTAREKRNLFDDVNYFNETKELHLLKYTPLSEDTKQEMHCEIEKFRSLENEEGELMEALYHSGIIYIEEAIKNYLNEYSLSHKKELLIDLLRTKFVNNINYIVIDANLKKQIDSESKLYFESKDILKYKLEDIELVKQEIDKLYEKLKIKEEEIKSINEYVELCNKNKLNAELKLNSFKEFEKKLYKIY